MPLVLIKSDNPEDFEPAGELSEQICEILGGISRIWKDFLWEIKDFQDFGRISKGSESRGQ